MSVIVTGYEIVLILKMSAVINNYLKAIFTISLDISYNMRDFFHNLLLTKLK
jgi:hypothetical protein